MNKEFVPYQESLELKQLGFNEPCFGTWLSNAQSNWKEYELILELGMNEEFEDNRNIYLLNGACSAPTFSQAFRWFREKYNYDIHIKGTHFRASYVIGISKEINMKSVDGYPLVISWDYIIDETGKRKTYEEAELACLRKLIEIVKQKV